MTRHVCAIIADDMLKKIVAKGTPTEKEAAEKTLLSSAIIRARRELAPVPQPHAEGEDRRVHDAQNTTNLPGKKVRSEHDESNGDQAVDEAFNGSGNTYRLFLGEFARKSIDGKGMALISTVHFDKNFDNAFWDGSQMVYGDGQFFNPFTRDLTVVGHELCHGVIQYTANLGYEKQWGAGNEHLADVFGALVEQYAYLQNVDQATWLIGGLLCAGKIQGRGLRDMLNPGTAYDDPVIGKDPQRAHMDNYYDGYEDNGGVHINSGIPNRAFALAAKEIGGYAWEKAGKIWFQVLTTRLSQKSDFQFFADATFIVAGELYGKGSLEQLAVLHGWAAVGITASDIPKPEPEPEPPPDSPCLPDLLASVAKIDRLLESVPEIRRQVRAEAQRFTARLHAGIKALDD